MWEYTNVKDTMRLHVGTLKPEELDGALAALLGGSAKDPLEEVFPCTATRRGRSWLQ